MRLLPLFVFWCLWFLNFSSRTCFSPLLPLIEDSLLLSHGQAGGLFTSYAFGYGLALLVTGRFVSIWGYRRTVVVGFLGLASLLVFLQWTESYFVFHLVMFGLGLSAGTYMPSILAIITEAYDPKDWGKAIGIHDSAASFSIFSMPVLVTLGLGFLPWRSLLLFLAGGCLFLPFLFWKVSKEPRGDSRKGAVRYRDILTKRTTWIIGLLWVFSAACNMGVYSILPLYLIKERGMDFVLANTFFGISRAGGIFVSILAGVLTDRFGYLRMLRWSLATTGLSTIGLALSSNPTQILIALIFQATCSLAFFPVGLAAISRLTPLAERSLTLAIGIAMGMVFGTGGSPFVLGLVADHMSFQIGILFLGILTTLCVFSIRFLEQPLHPGLGISSRS